MVLKVGDADMDTLREETKARLLATKGYRLKTEVRLLRDAIFWVGCKRLKNTCMRLRGRSVFTLPRQDVKN